MRQEFELTLEEFAAILEASKSVQYMVFGGRKPRSPQENANDAWCALGGARGFDGMSVQPSSKGDRFFTAEAVETSSLLGPIPTPTESDTMDGKSS